MEPRILSRPAPVATHPAPPAPVAPGYYVPIPRRLAADLRDAPVAVGAFALLARAFRASGQPIPLSAGDLQVFDPSISDGAATRAIKHLIVGDWVIPQRRPGRKTIYTPSWGSVRGTACPWDLQAPCLGRPRHIAMIRLDQRMLDVCMGRIDPHPTHPAQARRYLAAPLLGLREVGAYALALADLPVASPALEELRLLADGRPMPLPDEASILAIASQRGILSAEGWRRTPFGNSSTPAPDGESGQALFFVPPGQIGPMIGGVIAGPITLSAAPEPRRSPSGSPAAPPAEASAGSHGFMDQDGENPASSGCACPSPSAMAGGGERSLDPPPAPQPPAVRSETSPNGEGTRMLHSIGVRRSVATALGNRPPALIARVISQARERSDVRDLAGWVVAALRDLPDAAVAPPPGPPPSSFSIHERVDLPDEVRDRWVRRFHAAATVAEKRAVLERLAQEHPR